MQLDLHNFDNFETAEIVETWKTACSLETEVYYFKSAEIFEELMEVGANSATIWRPTCRRELHYFKTAEVFEIWKTACSLEAELHCFKAAEIFETWNTDCSLESELHYFKTVEIFE